MMQNKRFSNKDILTLLIPLLLEQILNVFVGIADTVMVSSAGEAAVSAVSLTDAINILIAFLLTAMSSGGAIVYAQSIGRGDEEYAKKAVSQLLLTVTVTAAAVCILFLIGNDLILNMLYGKAEPEVLENCRIYFRITVLGYPFMGIFNALSALNRSRGNSAVGLRASVIMNIVNISGNAILIFGFKMGVMGVAIPTVVSRMASAGIMLYLSLRKNAFLPISRNIKSYRPNKEIAFSILRIGIPTGIENSLFQVAKLGLSSLVAGLGTAATAAWAVVGHVAVFQYIPSSAVGIALMTVVGQCFGAKEYEQIKYYLNKFLKITYALVLATIVILLAITNPLVSLFNLSPEASIMAAVMLYMSCVGVLLHPVAFPTSHALRAVSDVRYTMVVSVSSVWIFRLGLAYLLVYTTPLGIYGAWGAQFADWLFRAVLNCVRIRKHYKAWNV